MGTSVHGTSTRRAKRPAPSARPQRPAPKRAASPKAARAAAPVKRTVVSRLKTPLVATAAAAAGVAGGIVLGARVLAPDKRVLGVRLGRKGIDLKPVAREIKRAGKQVGRLNDEIAMAREQAKKVGEALS